MNFLQKLFKRQAKVEDIKQNISSGNSFFSAGRATHTGLYINETGALSNSTVFSCVRVLAEAMSVLPANLYTRGKIKTLAADHPVNWIFAHEPNPETTPSTYKKTSMLHRVLWGNSYAWIRRDNGGRVRELYTLQPENMITFRDMDPTSKTYKKIKYCYTAEGRNIILDVEDVLHVPGLALDGIVGKSIIGLHGESIGLSVAAQDYGARFFGQGANPKGIVSMQEDLLPEQANQYREHFEALYGGLDNAHNVAVLSGGAKFEKITIPNNDAQFLETRQFQKKEICGIFGVPPIMIQDSSDNSAWGTGIETIMTGFVRNTLLPYLTAWEEAINQKLLTKEERLKYYIKFNIEGLQRGDFKSRMEGYQIGRNTGVYSINDIREMEDRPPVEGGDNYLIPLNNQAIGPDAAQINDQINKPKGVLQ